MTSSHPAIAPLEKAEDGGMSWLKRHATLMWPLAVLIILGLLVLIRIGPGWATRPLAPPQAEAHGVVTAGADAMATARRIAQLQGEAGRTREQLAAVQTQTSVRRERIATLEEMLASDSLTDCPNFLKEETTVRALQKIIREASETVRPPADDQNRLSIAATIARQRLRQKLEGLRDQLQQELGRLESQAEALRERLRLQTEELDLLDRQIRRQSQGRLLEYIAGPT